MKPEIVRRNHADIMFRMQQVRNDMVGLMDELKELRLQCRHVNIDHPSPLSPDRPKCMDCGVEL